MNRALPANVQYGIWLRSASSSGGKDWLGFVTDRGIIAQWGKTGMVVQSMVLSPRPSHPELQQRIDEKLGKGYRLVGEYQPGQGWSHHQPGIPQDTAQPPWPSPAPPIETDHRISRWLSEPSGQSWF